MYFNSSFSLSESLEKESCFLSKGTINYSKYQLKIYFKIFLTAKDTSHVLEYN